jgi:hypothetical protein
LKDLHIFSPGQGGVLQAAIHEASERGVVTYAETHKGFRVAARFEGADRINDLVGGNSFPAQSHKDHGGEEKAGDETGDEREKDEGND